MIRNIQRRYFEVWGNEEAQNVFLKGALSVLSILFLVQSIALTWLSLRKPLLIAVSSSDTQIFTVTPPSPELLESELKRWATQYVEAHYSWTFATIEKAHQSASRFVSDKFVKAFVVANTEQVRVAKEKHITERIYLSGEIHVDSKLLTARVPMDRIFTVDGLRATSPLTLDITFEYGPRTPQNPEGLYVTGEKVIPLSSTGG